MTAEQQYAFPPGWYHAQGDPEGTVRLWNGTEWVGYPQRDPNIAREPEQHRILPVAGQMRLMPWSILAYIGLLAPLVAYGYLAYTLFIVSGQVDAVTGVLDPEAAEATAFAGTAAVIAHVFAGPLFIGWFYFAYRNLSKMRSTEYEPMQAFLCWIIPFVNVLRPGRIMMEILQFSPAKDREGEINPIPGWFWWVIMVGAPVLARATLFWSVRSGSPSTISTVLLVGAITCALLVIAALIALWMVREVTFHQDRRFKRPLVRSNTTALARV